jgi:AcrR family transcriptional regulator
MRSEEVWSFDFARRLAERSRDRSIPKGQRTVIKLEAGAAAVLNDTPYQLVRVADITARAGVSHGLFYHYFNDKEAVTLKVVGDFLAAAEEAYGQIHQSEDVYESIRISNLFYLNLYERNAGLMRAILTLADEHEEFRGNVNELMHRWHGRMARTMRTAKGEKQLLLAYALGGMIDQLCRQLFVQKSPQLTRLVRNNSELADVISMIWYRSIFDAAPAGVPSRRAAKRVQS